VFGFVSHVRDCPSGDVARCNSISIGWVWRIDDLGPSFVECCLNTLRVSSTNFTDDPPREFQYDASGLYGRAKLYEFGVRRVTYRDKDIRVDNDLLSSRQWRLSIHLSVSLDIIWLCWRCFLLVEIREIHLVVDIWE